MAITIIEDASPFFIRFTFDGIENIIDIGKKCLADFRSSKTCAGIRMVDNFEVEAERNPADLAKFDKDLIIHYLVPSETQMVRDHLPWEQGTLPFENWAYEMLRTGPDFHYCIHKDRANFGINFFIDVPDDLCITNFYSDEDIFKANDHARAKECEVVDANSYADKGGPVRRTYNVNMDDLTPTKSYIGVQGEAMLINADIWHTWKNTSLNHRSALLLRPQSPVSRCSFEEIRLKLFGF